MCQNCDELDELRTYNKVKLASEAVARGIAFLDAHFPGWVSKINLSSFAITSTRECILGQVFADVPGRYAGQSGYDKGEDAIFKVYPEDDDYNREQDPYTLGFSTHDANWNELQNEWTEQVRKLQEAAKTTTV